MVVRAYQSELVEKVGALRGQNSIVVCTTGSGKTLVSALVIERVLALEEAGGVGVGLVIYLEKNRHLVTQQKKALDEHFRPLGRGADFIGEYVGGSVPWSWKTLKERHKIMCATRVCADW